MTIKRSISLASFIVLFAAVASAATVTEKIDRSFAVKPGSKVSLSNVNGHVIVGAWDQPKVQILATKVAEAGNDGDARKALNAIRVDIAQRGNDVVVETDLPDSDGGLFGWLSGSSANTRVEFTINVPRDAGIHVETVNGRVEVARVGGSVNVETVNGRVELSETAGRVDASTTNGGIKASMISSAAPVELSTTNGSITLLLPAVAKANVDAESVNGAIQSDFPITTSQIERNSLRGTINGGGTEVRLRTVNGAIRIQRGQ